jgi:hypothetical protein
VITCYSVLLHRTLVVIYFVNLHGLQVLLSALVALETAAKTMAVIAENSLGVCLGT